MQESKDRTFRYLKKDDDGTTFWTWLVATDGSGKQVKVTTTTAVEFDETTRMSYTMDEIKALSKAAGDDNPEVHSVG